MTKKLFSLLLCAVLCLSLALQVSARAPEEDTLIDEADLLTLSEESALLDRLVQLSNTYNTQFAVAILDYAQYGDAAQTANQLYRDMDYGFGSAHDGILLVICMDVREYQIVTDGTANDTISSGEIDTIIDAMLPSLKSGDYYGAVSEFLTQCELALSDTGDSGSSFEWGKYILGSLGVGLIVGLITVFVMKSKLKSVRRQNHANVYVRSGSLDVTRAEDLYLYRTVTRTAKPQNNNRSGGGPTNRGGGSF